MVQRYQVPQINTPFSAAQVEQVSIFNTNHSDMNSRFPRFFTAGSIFSFFLTFSLLVLANTVMIGDLLAQAIGDYRTNAASFTWTTTASWERYNGTIWVSNPAEGYPGQNAGTGLVTIRDGHIVTLNVSPAQPLGSFQVGEGVSGELRFDNTSGRAITVTGATTVSIGGTIFSSNTTPDGGADTHTLTSGNLTNNGTLTLRNADGVNFDVVNLVLRGDLAGSGISSFNNITFNGALNQTISLGGTVTIGGTTAGTITFNNTGTSPNNRIINNSTAFTTAIPFDRTTFTLGEYRHNNSAVYNYNSAGSITLGVNRSIVVLQGEMNFAPGDNAINLTLNGASLTIDGSSAIVRVGQNNTTANQSKLLTGVTSSVITVQNGGQLLVGNGVFGDIRLDAGGTVTVNGTSSLIQSGRYVSGTGGSIAATTNVTNSGLLRVGPSRTAVADLLYLRGGSALNINTGGDVEVGSSTGVFGRLVADADTPITATLNVDGAGSTLTISEYLISGTAAGNGTNINITNGAVVNIAQNLSAVFSAFYLRGTSTLTVSGGGVLNIGHPTLGFGRFVCDQDTPGSGVITVTGSGSEINISEYFLSGTTAGGGCTLNVLSGATFRTGRNLTVAGSAFFFRGNTTVNVTNSTLLVGNASDSTGNLTADQNNAFTRTMNVTNSTVRIYGRWLGIASDLAATTTYNVSNSLIVVSQNPSFISAGAQNSNLGNSQVNLSANSTLRMYENVTSVNSVNLVVFGINGVGGIDVTNSTLEILGNSNMANVLFGGGVSAATVSGVANFNSGSFLNIGVNTLSELPAPTSRSFLEIETLGSLNVDGGTLNIGGGNRGNLSLQGGAQFSLASGTVNVRASLNIFGGIGATVNITGGTLNIGNALSNGTNNITFPANPGVGGSNFILNGATAVVNVGDGNSTITLGNGNNDPEFKSTSSDQRQLFQLLQGTFNLNGRFVLNDAKATFEMSGGSFNINPNTDQNIPGSFSVLQLQRGIVNLTGGTITLINPPAFSGSGYAVSIFANSPLDSTNAALSGPPLDSIGFRWAQPTVLSGTELRFGNGVASASGSSEGYQVFVDASNVLGNVVVNNPSGVNRFVDWISRGNRTNAPILSNNRSYVVGNLLVTAGEFRANSNRFNPSSAGTFNFTLGSSSRFIVTNTNNFNYFPGDSLSFASYTLSPGSYFEYAGNGNQLVGSRNATTPPSFSNLVISGTTGTKTLSALNEVTDTLFLNSSTLSAGSNLRLSNGSTLSRSAGSLTGSIDNITNYRIRYTGNSKTTTATEWSGVGTKDLIVEMSSGQSLSLASSYTIDSLIVSSGSTLDLSAFSLLISGNAVNNGSQIGTGVVQLVNSTTHELTGTGSFTNLSINGPASSVTVNANQDFTINGVLTFENTSQNRILNLVGTARLTLGGTATVSNATATSTFLRMIQTDGTPSAVGVRKIWASVPASFTYPIGVSNKYTPVTVNITASATLGALTVKGVNEINPLTSDSLALSYYWSLSDSGLSSPVSTLSFQYRKTDIINGAETAFIPARYSPVVWSRINDVSQVNESDSTIVFNSVNYLTGDFTAGEPSSFGAVLTYYSRASGNWTDPNTWSTTGIGGPVAGTTPNSRRPVFIGGTNVVTANISNLRSASLEIQSGGTLALANATTGHSFGVVSGTGTLRLQSNTSTPPAFPGGTYTTFLSSSGGRIEYGGTGIYTIPSTPTTYNTLAASGGGTKTLPDANLTLSGNLEVSGTTTLLFSNATSGNITVGGEISTGVGSTLSFNGGSTPRAITAASINNNGTFNLAGVSVLSNTLSISGSIQNSGTLDFINGSQVCNVTFTSTSNGVISGSGSYSFNRFIVNKGTSQSPSILVTATNFSIDGPTTGPVKAIEIVNGNLRIGGTGSITLNLSTDNENYTIPTTGQLTVENANATVNVGATGFSTGLILRGALRIESGTVNVGTDFSGISENSITYEGTGSSLTVINGTLNVVSNIQPGTGAALNYTQSGGIVRVQRGRQSTDNTSVGTVAAFTMNSSASQFNMSGGDLEVVGSHTVSATSPYTAIRISASPTFNVTGGNVRIGTSAMNVNGRNDNVAITSTVPFWNLFIGYGTDFTGNIGNVNGAGTLTVLNDLTVNLSGQFRLNRVDFATDSTTNILSELVVGGNLTVLNGYIRSGFAPDATGGSQIQMNGSGLSGQTNPQVITASNLVVRRLRIFNTSGGVQLAANSGLTVTRTLNVASGSFNANFSNANVTFYSDAGVLDDFAQSILGNATFHNLTINRLSPTFTSVSTTGNLAVNNQLVLTNGLLNIGDNLLSINNPSATAITGGVFSASRSVRTSGSSSSAGVRWAFPNSVTVPFIFPFSTDATYYRPVSISVTTADGAGTVQIAPTNSRYPSASSTSLNYNWKTTVEGFGAGVILSHTYNYVDVAVETDVPTVGGDGSYETGIFNGFTWTTSTGTINSGSNFFTLNTTGNFTNYFFTAGTGFVDPVIFYSWRNGLSGGSVSWDAATNDPATSPWSADSTSFVYVGSDTEPTSTNPVVIRDGHTMNISTGVKTAASVEIRIGSVLNITSASAQTFGLGISGTGTLRIESNVLPQLQSSFLASGGGTVEFSGSTDYTLPSSPLTYNNVQISGTSNKTVNGSILSVIGNLTVASGTLTIAQTSSAFDRSGSGGTFTLGSTGNLVISGSGNYPRNFATYSIQDGSTVTYNFPTATTNQDIAPLNSSNGGGYSNLVLSRQATNTQPINKRMIGETVVRGNLTLEADTRLLTQNNNLTIGGNLTLNGTAAGDTSFVQIGTSTVTFNGLGIQLISKANVTNELRLRNVNLTGTGIVRLNTASMILNVDTLNIALGSTFDVNGRTLRLQGNLVNNGTFTSATGTTAFVSSTLDQTIRGNNPVTFSNLTITKATGLNLDILTPVTVNNTFTMNANGLVRLNGTTNNFTFGPSALTSGPFSSSRKILMDGTETGSRVVRTGTTPAQLSFTFPIGISGDYNPYTVTTASIASGAPTGFAVRIVSPNNSYTNAFITSRALGQSFETEVLGTGSINSTNTFTYSNSLVNGTEVNYVVRYYDGAIWQTPTSPTINTASDIAGHTANVAFSTGINYEWIVGELAAFSPPLYSRNATLGGNWDDVNSWTVSFDGTGGPAGTFPTSVTDVTVLTGHTITTNSNGQSAASLSIVGSGVVDISTNNTTGHTFGTLTGDGTLRLRGTFPNYTISGTTFFDITNGGLVDYSSTASYNLPATPTTYNDVTISGGGTKTLSSNIVVTDFEIASLTTLDANNSGNYSIQIFDDYTNNGTFEPRAGLVEFSATVGTQNLGGTLNFHNLTLDGGTTKNINAPLTLSGNFRIQSASGPVNIGANTITLSGGNWRNDAAANVLTSTSGHSVTFTSTSGEQTITGVTQFRALNVDKAGQSLTLNDSISVTDDLTITAGTLNSGVYGIAISGNLTNDGNINAGTGTYTFNGNGSQVISGSAISPDFNFNNLTIQGSTNSVEFTSNANIVGDLNVASGTLFAGESATLVDLDSVTIGASGTFDASNISSITLSESWVNNGTFTSGSSNVTFSGTSVNQAISGSQVTSFYDLTVDKTTGDLTINSNQIVSNSLNLTNGVIVIPSATLRLTDTDNGDGASGTPIIGGSTTSFVEGNVRIDYPNNPSVTRRFPSGHRANTWNGFNFAVSYLPVELTVSHVSGSNSFTLRQVNTNAPAGSPAYSLGTLSKVSSMRYFAVSNSGGGTYNNGSVTLSWNADDFVSAGGIFATERNSLRAASLDIASSAWENLGDGGQTGDESSGTITSSVTFTQTDAFALGTVNPADNPLPVELAEFKVVPTEGRTTTIQWRTRSEFENLGFIVKRSENQNDGFEEIASYRTIESLKGLGTNSTGKEYSFIDNSRLQAGRTYYYKLIDVSFGGVVTEHQVVSVRMPDEYTLSQNYPNPFNPATTIEFSLKQAGRTTLEVYNVLGQKVGILVDGNLQAGAHRYSFNGLNLSSGVYFYRLRSGDFNAVKKMMLIK
ncbi:MAG: T9SS type A sorting domain-containing protein [Chloroherpetonaceae bacterium]|nr:T9SS type A sorting domain-containing protein [Chloroherpetonaceae bacterium]